VCEPQSQPPLGHCVAEAQFWSSQAPSPEDFAAGSAAAAVLAVVAQYAERFVENVFVKWPLTMQLLLLLLLLLMLLQIIVQMMMNWCAPCPALAPVLHGLFFQNVRFYCELSRESGV